MERRWLSQAARSSLVEELEKMLELLIDELEKAGLKLNFTKTKILYSYFMDEGANFDWADIAGQFIQIIHPDRCHLPQCGFLVLCSSH